MVQNGLQVFNQISNISQQNGEFRRIRYYGIVFEHSSTSLGTDHKVF